MFVVTKDNKTIIGRYLKFKVFSGFPFMGSEKKQNGLSSSGSSVAPIPIPKSISVKNLPLSLILLSVRKTSKRDMSTVEEGSGSD